MPFQRFVETGRVALVSDGPHKGKLVSIVDVIDQTRVLVDGPGSQVPRGAIRLNQLHLTKFRIKFSYTAPTRVVRKAWETAKIDEKWKDSMWAKKLENKKKRAAMSDFDRFKLRKARQIRNKIRSLAFYKLRKAAIRDGTLYGKKKKSALRATPKCRPLPAERAKRKAEKAAKKAERASAGKTEKPAKAAAKK